MTTTTPRPNQASILTKAGWIAISCGLLMLMLSVMAFFVGTVLAASPGAMVAGAAAANAGGFPLDKLVMIGLVHGTISLVTVIAGIAILKGHAWARTLLEGLCWTTGVEVVIYTVLFTRMMSGAMSFQETVVLWVMYGYSGFCYLLGVVLAIRALRSEPMHEALEEYRKAA